MMEKALKAMMAKKKQEGSEMSEPEKKAKMSVLQDLRGQAMEKMGEGLKMRKASSVGEAQMEKAKEDLSGGNYDEEDAAHEASESPEHEAMEHGLDVSDEEKAMSAEELDAKIKCLEDLKKQKEQPKA